VYYSVTASMKDLFSSITVSSLSLFCYFAVLYNLCFLSALFLTAALWLLPNLVNLNCTRTHTRYKTVLTQNVLLLLSTALCEGCFNFLYFLIFGFLFWSELGLLSLFCHVFLYIFLFLFRIRFILKISWFLNCSCVAALCVSVCQSL